MEITKKSFADVMWDVRVEMATAGMDEGKCGHRARGVFHSYVTTLEHWGGMRVAPEGTANWDVLTGENGQRLYTRCVARTTDDFRKGLEGLDRYCNMLHNDYNDVFPDAEITQWCLDGFWGACEVEREMYRSYMNRVFTAAVARGDARCVKLPPTKPYVPYVSNVPKPTAAMIANADIIDLRSFLKR